MSVDPAAVLRPTALASRMEVPAQAGPPSSGTTVMLRDREHCAAAAHYLSERVATASPAQLIGMLFDGAVGALTKAGVLQKEGRFLDANTPLIRAQEIVLELRCSLNQDTGDLAGRLDALYAYAHGRLVHANVSRDLAATHEVREILDQLRLAWRQAVMNLPVGG